MKECPTCGKHLLSQASAKCSWCGAVIADAEYQALAGAERAAYFAHTAAHDAASLAAYANLNIPGDTQSLYSVPLSLRQAREQERLRLQQSSLQKAQAERDAAEHVRLEQEKARAEASAVADETEQAEERFRHLEIE